MHIIRYDYDAAQDTVPNLSGLSLDLRLPGEYTLAEAFSPYGSPAVTLQHVNGDHLRLSLRDLPLYTVIKIK